MELTRRTLLSAAGALPLAARAAEPRRLIVPLVAEPAVLVPSLSEQPGGRIVGTKLYQGLLRFSADLQPQPELATNCAISADELTYSFALRPGVTWHDGTAFTATDVLFSFNQFHRALTPALAPLLAKVVRLDADGPRRFTITLAAPFPPLLSLIDALGAPIVPRHVHDRSGFALDPHSNPPVGTGPFRYLSWLRLAAFAGFAGPPVHLDEIAFPILPDPAARLEAAQSGQPVLLAGDALPVGAVPRLRQQGMQVAGETPPNHTMLAWLAVNPSVPPMNDRRVRMALSQAIDRAALLQDVWAGFGRVAAGEYDPRASAKQLDGAGLRPDDDGIRLHMRHLVRAEGPWPRLGAVIREALGQVGIAMTIESVAPAVWASRINVGDYQTTGMAEAFTGPRTVSTDISKLLLAELSIPVAADRRLQDPSGVLSSFADARLMP